MLNIWNDMFVLGLPIAEKILRSIFVYAFLIVGLRLAGKRELAQLNPFDLVVLLTLSNTVQNAIIGNDNSVSGGLIGAATLLTINYCVVRFLFQHPKMERVVIGSPSTLIQNGKINEAHLKKEMMSKEELIAAARRQGISDLCEVDEATIEPGGMIVFSEKKPHSHHERHQELMKHIQALTAEIAELKKIKGSTYEK